ncbi:TPA: hypothetical protein ACH3X2_000796 [Trebouxia sp. C0005]
MPFHTGNSGVVVAVLICQAVTAYGWKNPSTRQLLGTCATAGYQQCGGLSCPGPYTCADAPGACCPSGYSCTRGNAYYWQCTPVSTNAASPSATTSPAATPTATTAATPAATTCINTTNKDEKCDGYAFGAYTQCGGTTNCPAASCTCSDASWTVGCCPDGYSCGKVNSSVWECLPDFTTNSPEVSPASTPASTPAASPAGTSAATTAAAPSPTTACINPTNKDERCDGYAFGAYAQCGGSTNCPSASCTCSDAEWTVGCCADGYQCGRVNSTVWECLPAFTTASPTAESTPVATAAATSAATTTTAGCSVTVAMYAQCGGKSNCPSGSNCADAQWTGECCASGSTCTRSNEWYWQCL